MRYFVNRAPVYLFVVVGSVSVQIPVDHHRVTRGLFAPLLNAPPLNWQRLCRCPISLVWEGLKLLWPTLSL